MTLREIRKQYPHWEIWIVRASRPLWWGRAVKKGGMGREVSSGAWHCRSSAIPDLVLMLDAVIAATGDER